MDGPNLNPPADAAPLFNQPAPSRRPQVCPRPVFGTSHAAELQASRKSESRRAFILRCLAEQPLTVFEIAARLGVSHHTISGRFTDLAKDQKIEPTGECRRHPNSGLPCTIWRLKGRF